MHGFLHVGVEVNLIRIAGWVDVMGIEVVKAVFSAMKPNDVVGHVVLAPKHTHTVLQTQKLSEKILETLLGRIYPQSGSNIYQKVGFSFSCSDSINHFVQP